MSVSALTYTIGPLTPPSAGLSSETIGSQVAHQISSSTSDANSSGLVFNASGAKFNGKVIALSDIIDNKTGRFTDAQKGQADDLLQGGGASAVTPPGNPLIKAIGVASESVTITLSAAAQKAIAQQNQALGQLRQLNEQLRTSNHDAAAARLQHLLQEFHALQQFGTASARALAALAKEISAAATDLSAGGGNGAAPTIDTSFANETLAAGQTPDEPANAQGDGGSAASATSSTAVTSSNAPQVAAGTTAAPTQSVAADAPSSEGQHAATLGSQTADSRTPATSSGSPDPGAVAASAAQRQALLDHLKDQAGQNAAQTQAASADRDLLTQAADAVGAIQSIVKQAAEDEREKHGGKSGTALDQLAKTVDASVEAIEKAISQIETAPASTPSSGAISAVGGSVDVTV
jgi:hypothetical protein